MLTLSNFSVSILGKQILHSLNYIFEKGLTTAILGHNGSGKSSLAFAIMGHPRYQCSGQILLDETNIVNIPPNNRHER